MVKICAAAECSSTPGSLLAVLLAELHFQAGTKRQRDTYVEVGTKGIVRRDLLAIPKHRATSCQGPDVVHKANHFLTFIGCDEQVLSLLVFMAIKPLLPESGVVPYRRSCR